MKKLNTKTIFKNTSEFILRKIGISFLSMLILILPMLILFGIGRIFSSGISILLTVIGFILGIKLRNIFDRYFGYMIKAAHIAVITETIENGVVPQNQIEYGKSMVKSNFTEANIYFVIDNLISKAVSQIQKSMSGISEFIGNIIPMGEQFIGQFIKASLDYIDECCLGYTFYRKDEKNKFKSSCDGIVLYFQNWKDLLKTALKSSLIAVTATAIIFIIITLVLGILLRLFIDGTTAFTIAIILGIIISGVLKSAIIDTYVYIDIMNSFLPFAMEQKPKTNLYENFCKVSSAFKELFNKSQKTISSTIDTKDME